MSSDAALALQKTFGSNVRRYRGEMSLSQRALSALTGISQRHISQIEMGGEGLTMTVNVSIETIAVMSVALGRTPAEMLTPLSPPDPLA